MADAPIFAAEYEGASWVTSSHPKTAAVDLAPDDVLIVLGGAEADGLVISTPTGGSLTYTPLQSVVVSNRAAAYAWGLLSVSGQTYTLSVDTNNFSLKWGFNAVRFSTSAGVGDSAKANAATTGTAALNLTTTGDNSAVVCIIADFNATDWTSSRVWRTVNGITPTAGNGLELTYVFDSSAYTVGVAYWNDCGATGTYNFGLTTPSSIAYSMILVEVLASGAPPAPGGTSPFQKQLAWQAHL